jgi:B12-binding domain/radical SAM domain protein
VLLNAWESLQIDRHFEISIREKPLDTPPYPSIAPDDVILFSFMTPHLPPVHREIKKIKETGAIIAGGGPHITGEQELLFEMGFDILFVGPGETSFLTFGRDLLENHLEKKKIYRCPDPGTRARDLNGYFPVTKYLKGLSPLEIMRGCSWNCKYCTTGRQRAVFRELDSIKSFLDRVRERKFTRINYICPSSMEYRASAGRKLNLEKIEEILCLTRSYSFKFVEYGIFPSEIRPDTVSEEGMRMLKKYVSHKAVTLGAQSGADRRLKELNRGHAAEDIERAAAIANACGFLANLDFITAYPGESPAERRVTLDFIKKLNKKYRIRTHIHHFFPLSGSAYAFRFPSFLSEEERNALRKLTTSGISRDGWIKNEEQVKEYFEWLKENFPAYYARYE